MSLKTKARAKDHLEALRSAHRILSDENRALRNDNYMLAQALRRYIHCPHGSVNCFCTKEAKAALHERPA